MDLFDLVAKITLDSSQYEQGLRDAEGKASGFGSTLKTAMKVGGAAIAAVGTAAIGLSTAFVAGAGSVAEYGDNVDKMSQKMGLSAQAYQEWDAIMQHSGTSIETMKAGMKTLANAVESGNDAFQRIGLTQEQIASMSQEDLFAATIAGLQNVENETERTYLAGQLLGRGATELGALLNTSAEDTEAMRQRVHELGGVMSDEAVKAAARYQDSLQDMKTAFSGLSRNMMSQFLPSISTVMDGLSDLFSGGDGLGKISEGINEFVGKLSAVLPKVMKSGSQIVLALGKAIVKNLPVLIGSAADVIMTIAKGLVQNLPLLVRSGLQIIVMLAKSIASSLPQLVPTIVDVVLEIVDVLIDNVDLLIEASLQIIIALAEGLIKSLPVLLSKAPQIIASLVKAIIGAVGQLGSAALQIVKSLAQSIGKFASQLVSKGAELVSKVGQGVKSALSGALNWGRELINNFVKGINQAWENVKGTVSGVANKIAGVFKHSVPRSGPFKRDDLWGAHMIQNFTDGLLSKAPDLIRAATTTAEGVANAMQFGNMSVGGSYSAYGDAAYNGAQSQGVAIYGDVHISIDGTGQNAEQIGREFYKQLVGLGVAAYAY